MAFNVHLMPPHKPHLIWSSASTDWGHPHLFTKLLVAFFFFLNSKRLRLALQIYGSSLKTDFTNIKIYRLV